MAQDAKAKGKGKAKHKRPDAVGPAIGANVATPVSNIKTLKDFKVELIYSVPGGSLTKFGADLDRARRKRHLTVPMMAERVGVAKSTQTRIEKGDAAVPMAGVCDSVVQQANKLTSCQVNNHKPLYFQHSARR